MKNLKNKEAELLKLENSLKNKNTTKIQILIENLIKKNKVYYKKATMEEFKEEDLMDINLFYLKERNNRLLYHDGELQALIISIIMTLIITPTRGTLDDLYCSREPFENNKMNILFILHQHLNHNDNQDILPILLKYVAEIQPFGAGQRLMKLLIISLFDKTIYKDWKRIATGAYGKVYECSTKMAEPSTVAIKKIQVPENIFDFCHLFYIFTEITALETFRMEGCVTHLYDYGVDQEYYYIVMKRYQMSLKQWREAQKGDLKDMLPTYLNIYKDILKAVSHIHSFKTTHYDLKCDNVVIDFTSQMMTGSSSGPYSTDDNTVCVKIADFGECKMFLNEQDEFCVRSRGTDVIKSPEMLTNYGFNPRRDADNYDRRKNMGTTRASDIWSVGCLLYELLTGKFLFEEIQEQYIEYMVKINTMNIQQLLTEEKLKEINYDTYIIDFLKYVLVKDQNYRPNIEAVMKRFEHVHALCATNHSNNMRNTNISKRMYQGSLENSLEVCVGLLMDQVNQYSVEDSTIIKNKHTPGLMKITEEMYICELSYAENNLEKFLKLGVTHIITWTKPKNKDFSDKILHLNLYDPTTSADFKKPVFNLLFKVIDFIRHCIVYRGIIVFIDDFQNSNLTLKPNNVIRSLTILSISYFLQLSAYDAWSYINSKLLFFSLPASSLSQISLWVMNQTSLVNLVFSFPILRCLCGACVLVMKRQFTNHNLMNIRTCVCSVKNKNNEFSDCPSQGCYDYIQDIKVKPFIN
jgi:serine/threonine protein kinase